VPAIIFDVVQVVDDVTGRGSQAEDDEGEEGVGDLAGVGVLTGKDQRGEDEDVLDPVRGADKLREPPDTPAGICSHDPPRPLAPHDPC
jgi:hypothetical protein